MGGGGLMPEHQCPTCGRARTDLTPEQKKAIIQLVFDSLKDWRSYEEENSMDRCIPQSVQDVLKNLFPEGV